MAKNVSLTSYSSQLAEIDRQKRLANLLQQQAQTPIEIQSYKGTQAPIAWTSVLAKVLGQVGGQMKEARAIKKEGELSALDREAARGLIKSINDPVTSGGFSKAPTSAPNVTTADLAKLLTRPEVSINPIPDALPAQGSPMGVPPQGARMGGPPMGGPPTDGRMAYTPPQAPPMGGPLQAPPMVNTGAPQPMPMGGPPQSVPMINTGPPPNALQAAANAVNVPLTTRARSPAEQQQMALEAMMSGAAGPMTQGIGKTLYESAVGKQTKAEDRASAQEDLREGRIYNQGITAEARAYGEAQRVKLIAEQAEKTRKFVENFSQYAPKDASGKVLVDPMQFAALAEAGDLAGAAKLYTDAGGDYRKAQQQLNQFNQTIALERQKFAAQREDNRQSRANALRIAQTRGTDLRYTPVGGQKAIIGDRKTIQQIRDTIKLVRENPKSFGLQNAIGDEAMTRYDPKGVAARAAVTAVSGVKFHDFAGSAQTPKEIGRLRPFIPSSTNDAKSVITKLEKLQEEAERNLDVNENFYSPENGYRPISQDDTFSNSSNTASIPQDAIADLRRNPKTAAQFDEIFGSGSADEVLGR
jgi:hypothetical protein